MGNLQDGTFELLAKLAARYPAAFKREKDTPVPLKIGIREDIVRVFGGEVSTTRIRNAMRVYTQRAAYHQVMVEGAKRVDLAGRICGEVTKDAAVIHRQRMPGMNHAKAKS